MYSNIAINPVMTGELRLKSSLVLDLQMHMFERGENTTQILFSFAEDLKVFFIQRVGLGSLECN